MANKQERIAGIIRKGVAEIIQIELKNPHLGFVTIPEVKVSADISYATAPGSRTVRDSYSQGPSRCRRGI